jgi:hypothetical protein
MTREEAEAQAELRRVVEELKGIRARLRAIAGGLPEDPSMPVEDEEPDVATEVRSIIECVLADQIGPAVRDLGAAVEYRVRERKER